MGTFQAVWPIVDAGMAATLLFVEAHRDLPAVAARHRVRITGEPSFAVCPGRRIPGSQGAAFVVTATAPAEPLGAREYGQPHPFGEVA
ncbi:hypothetical protein [Arthrobacter luteolus]|uniref:hypothetical protein n=1 Tax=Arthrobacter luteolus TaxID=98672 RepID=UPI00082EA630|nr:hypothetical protein [Arthrobacter luteolus]